MEEKRKSIIRKKIGRKIQTKQFESLDIYVDIEEEIEWINKKERDKKTEAVTKILVEDYKKTADQVLKDLKLSHNKASVKAQSEEPSQELMDKVKEEADGIF